MATDCHRRLLATSGVLVRASEDPGLCPICGGPMGVQKSACHWGVTIKHGMFHAQETVHVCAAGCRHPSGALVTRRAACLARILIPRRQVGYDVMVAVGLKRFRDHRQRGEIRRELIDQGVDLSPGEISGLAGCFLEYLEELHIARSERLRAALQADGGYPLHIDATGEDGRGTLFLAIAGWRRWVLDARKIPTERADSILPVLRSVVGRFGPPCRVVRDLGRAMIRAADDLLAELGLDIRVLACHAHFLCDVGTDLLDPGHGELRDQFRRFKVRTTLRALARDLGRTLGADIARVRDELTQWLEQDRQGHELPPGQLGLAEVRALAQWVVDFNADAPGQDFPMARPYLAFYERCVRARRTVDAFFRKPPEDSKLRRALGRLRQALDPVTSEAHFAEVARGLRKRAELFDELRDALRLFPEDGDVDETSAAHPSALQERITELKDIEADVERLVISLRKRRPERGPAEDFRNAIDIILDHIEDHGPYLWGHIVELPAAVGGGFRIVDRTNNIPETGIRDIKHGERRRSGRKILTQDFEYLPAAAALVSNLAHADYVEILCGSLDRLADAFADLDAERRRRALTGAPNSSGDRRQPPDPELASASLPSGDRRLVRSEAMGKRVLGAATSRAPRTAGRPLRTGTATAE